MSKKASMKNTPTGESLTAEEQSFFDSAGETELAAEAREPEAVAEEPEVGPELEEVEAESDGGTPEGEPESADAEPEPQQRQKMVPHAALHEEREQRKAAQARTRELEEAQAKLLARTDELLQRAIQQPQPGQQEKVADQGPNPEEDPIGYLTWANTKLAERQQEYDRHLQQQNEQSQQYQALSQLQSEALAAEAEFRSETPDYDQAAQFMQQSRSRELQAMGYNGQQVSEQLRYEAIGLAARARENRTNPGKLIYDMAQARGYVPSQAGEPPVAAPGAPGQPTAQERLQTVSAGQRQSRTLSGASGSAPSPMTAQRLLEMSEADFAAYKAKAPKEFRNLMGS